jgi:hypothetical protein
VITGDEQRVIDPAPAIRITPNPSDLSHARVQFPAPLSGEYLLTLFDMNGRQVYQKRYSAVPGSKDIDLDDLSFLDPGMYLLKVSGQDGSTGYLKLIRN